MESAWVRVCVESAWVRVCVESAWVRVLKVLGKFGGKGLGMRAWKVRGYVGVESAWKVAGVCGRRGKFIAGTWGGGGAVQNYWKGYVFGKKRRECGWKVRG